MQAIPHFNDRNNYTLFLLRKINLNNKLINNIIQIYYSKTHIFTKDIKK